MLETEGYEILYDEASNRVTGIKARAHDGTDYTINAKSVILCTGGFAGSAELEAKYLSQNPYFDHFGDEQWTMIGMHENDGKMLEAALAIGAGTYNISIVPMIHFATSNIVIHDYPVHTFEEDEPGYGHVLWYGWEQTWSLNELPNALVLYSDIPWVDADGETPIGGLWACGCDTSGVLYSEKKPYVTYGGAAIGFAYTSGRLSGGYAVDYASSL